MNVYVVDDNDGWTIIDTGIDDLPTRHLWQALLDGPLAGRHVSRIIVTHHHPDHIGLAGWLCRHCDAPLFTSQTAFLSYRDIEATGSSGKQPDFRNFYRSHGMSAEIADIVSTQGNNYLTMVAALPPTFIRLVAGDTVDIGGRPFDVLSGDGHAPEQIMLASPELRLFIAADQVLEKISPNVSVWALEPDGDPLGLYMRSLDFLQTVDYDPLVLPGHRLPFYGLAERSRELKAHHEERCDLIADAVAAHPMTVAELVPVLFKRKLDPQQTSFAFSECHAHVNRMIRSGRLEWVDVSRNGVPMRACTAPLG
ncbi:MBL fold metallo-hydrolase [Mesorhizobium sp. CCNWLW179-1]|uniref:MBL fold metallo-hydrolase n=1 Tax=unclassified Mesorhizobium TaxID=325217 RepID=UPI00301444A6